MRIIQALRDMGATQIQVGDIRVIFEQGPILPGDPFEVKGDEPSGEDLLFWSADQVKHG